MKKTKDEMRLDYKRSDFVKLEKGKFYAEVAAGTSVVLFACRRATSDHIGTEVWIFIQQTRRFPPEAPTPSSGRPR